MVCKNCGNEIAANEEACPVCGELAELKEKPEETISETAEAVAAETEADPVQQKKISKGLLWGLIGGGIALAVIIAAVLVFMFSKGNSGVRFGMTQEAVEAYMLEQEDMTVFDTEEQYDATSIEYRFSEDYAGMLLDEAEMMFVNDALVGVTVRFSADDKDAVHAYAMKKYGNDYMETDNDEYQYYVWFDGDTTVVSCKTNSWIMYYNNRSDSEWVNSKNSWFEIEK